MKEMALSIIIPVYNAEATLSTALKSIAVQKYKPQEIVIIYKNSADATWSIIQSAKSALPMLRVYQGEDDGIYQAMNEGIEKANADWIYFMGADDQIHDEDVLKNISTYLTASEDIVYGDCVWEPDGIVETGNWTYDIFITANINHQRIFYRKALFDEYGDYNTEYKIASDHELNIRFFCNEKIKKKYIPLKIAKYHSGGFSANKLDEKFWQDWDAIIKKNFSPYLPVKKVYGSLYTYFRWLVDKGEKKKAAAVLWKHFKKTASPGFLKLAISYWLKK